MDDRHPPLSTADSGPLSDLDQKLEPVANDEALIEAVVIEAASFEDIEGVKALAEADLQSESDLKTSHNIEDGFWDSEDPMRSDTKGLPENSGPYPDLDREDDEWPPKGATWQSSLATKKTSNTQPTLNTDAESKRPMQGSLKGQVEAALFVTNRPLAIVDLAHLVHASLDDVEEALMELMNDYAFREDSALEIDDADGYILQVKSHFRPVLDEMLPMEISHGALKTLSIIAIKGPILQSALVDIRGSAVYDQIPELIQRKLVTKKREGRSYKLNVTQTFYDYFRLKGNKKELEVMMALMDDMRPAQSGVPGQAPRTGTPGETVEASDLVAPEAIALKEDLFIDIERPEIVAK